MALMDRPPVPALAGTLMNAVVLALPAWLLMPGGGRLNFSQISNKKLGEQYGLEWAEWYHYISDLEDGNPNNLEKYVEANAK